MSLAKLSLVTVGKKADSFSDCVCYRRLPGFNLEIAARTPPLVYSERCGRRSRRVVHHGSETRNFAAAERIEFGCGN